MNGVVVTGLGVVTPIGIGPESFWDGLMTGASGAGPIDSFDASGFPVRIAAEVRGFDASPHVNARQAARMDRFCQMGVVAAGMAVEHAALEHPDGERAGVVVGTGIGGLATIEEQHRALLESGPRGVSPFMVPRLMPNGAAAAISMHLGFHGPNYSIATACATGAHAIGEAALAISMGRAEVMLAGGSEAALTPLSLAAFARMGALSLRNDDPERASRPFDANRDGFVFGEGAGILVLESENHARRRNATVLAEVLGYGASADAFHVTQPDPQGRGAVRAMRGALDDARLNESDVDHINAHGTSTPFNDRVETLAIKEVFGNEAKGIPVVSTKSQTGHLLGAAGAVEAAACVLTIQRSTIPSTINLDTPDAECDLDYVSEGPREQPVRVAMSNSFGFGGQNACLVFGAPS
jgi:3-oxoacyl-[acyl-carrier-protein] synthase II